MRKHLNEAIVVLSVTHDAQGVTRVTTTPTKKLHNSARDETSRFGICHPAFDLRVHTVRGPTGASILSRGAAAPGGGSRPGDWFE